MTLYFCTITLCEYVIKCNFEVRWSDLCDLFAARKRRLYDVLGVLKALNLYFRISNILFFKKELKTILADTSVNVDPRDDILSYGTFNTANFGMDDYMHSI